MCCDSPYSAPLIQTRLVYQYKCLSHLHYQNCLTTAIPLPHAVNMSCHCCHGNTVTDGEEEERITKLRDKMIKNMELCQGRINELS